MTIMISKKQDDSVNKMVNIQEYYSNTQNIQQLDRPLPNLKLNPHKKSNSGKYENVKSYPLKPGTHHQNYYSFDVNDQSNFIHDTLETE
jgi:hypothetical protein